VATFILPATSRMAERLEEALVRKKEWRKPEVKSIAAGSAETGTGSAGDAAGGGNIHS